MREGGFFVHGELPFLCGVVIYFGGFKWTARTIKDLQVDKAPSRYTGFPRL